MQSKEKGTSRYKNEGMSACARGLNQSLEGRMRGQDTTRANELSQQGWQIQTFNYYLVYVCLHREKT